MLTTCVSCNKNTNDKTSGGDKKPQDKISSSNKSSNADTTSSDTASPDVSGGVSSGEAVKTSVIKDKNYGGKTFTMCVWEVPTETLKEKVAAFNKKHNANVEIKTVLDFYEDVPKSISSGKPFDIVNYSPVFYSSKFMESNFEALNDYISDLDYSNDKGISKNATEIFTYKGNIYSAVSSRSVLPYVIYYHKELSKQKFGGTNPYDPYTIWKAGNWNFKKMKELSYADFEFAALANVELNVWLDISGVSAVSRNADSFSSALKNADVKSALDLYKNMFHGSTRIMSSNIHEFNPKSMTSPSFYKIGTIEDYEVYAQSFKNVLPNGLKISNLGVVPLPKDMYKNGKYPAKISRAYSSVKGAGDPSIAACFALFESSFDYTSCQNTLPEEIYNAVYSEFNKGGYIGYNSGYPTKQNSDILSGNSCIKATGTMIAKGAAVDQAINQFDNLLTTAINYNS